MDRKGPAASTVDEYISGFPPEIQERLTAIRTAIREAAPEAEERISYAMPAYHDNGVLIYFAAFTDHISIFPTPEGIEAFQDELSAYKSAKGTVHFPHGQPLPLELIARIARQRSDANRQAATDKQRQAEAGRAARAAGGRKGKKPAAGD